MRSCALHVLYLHAEHSNEREGKKLHTLICRLQNGKSISLESHICIEIIIKYSCKLIDGLLLQINKRPAGNW